MMIFLLHLFVTNWHGTLSLFMSFILKYVTWIWSKIYDFKWILFLLFTVRKPNIWFTATIFISLNVWNAPFPKILFFCSPFKYKVLLFTFLSLFYICSVWVVASIAIPSTPSKSIRTLVVASFLWFWHGTLKLNIQ